MVGARNKAFYRLNNFFMYYGIESSLYGSYAVNMALKKSDVDMVLSPKFLMSEEGEIPIDVAFGYWESYFSNIVWVREIKSLPFASTPIIKLIIDTEVYAEELEVHFIYNELVNAPLENEALIRVDMSVHQPNTIHTGLQAT